MIGTEGDSHLWFFLNKIYYYYYYKCDIFYYYTYLVLENRPVVSLTFKL